MERAHTEAAEKLGAKTSYGHSSNPDKRMNLGSLFLTALSNFWPMKGQSFHAYSIYDRDRTPKEKAVGSAGGLNYQTALTSAITSQNIRNRQIHVVDQTYLLLNKVAIALYYLSGYFMGKDDSSSNDLTNYISNLEKQGYIKPKKIEKLAKEFSSIKCCYSLCIRQYH